MNKQNSFPRHLHCQHGCIQPMALISMGKCLYYHIFYCIINRVKDQGLPQLRADVLSNHCQPSIVVGSVSIILLCSPFLSQFKAYFLCKWPMASSNICRSTSVELGEICIMWKLYIPNYYAFNAWCQFHCLHKLMILLYWVCSLQFAVSDNYDISPQKKKALLINVICSHTPEQVNINTERTAMNEHRSGRMLRFFSCYQSLLAWRYSTVEAFQGTDVFSKHVCKRWW